MIRMKQPSLVVHSHDVPGYKYQMKWTWLTTYQFEPIELT